MVIDAGDTHTLHAHLVNHMRQYAPICARLESQNEAIKRTTE